MRRNALPAKWGKSLSAASWLSFTSFDVTDFASLGHVPARERVMSPRSASALTNSSRAAV
jgi:hypothetical protein